MDERDPYADLELAFGAGETEVKDAYRKLSRRYHPDHNPHRREWAEARFRKITEAYEDLCNPDWRRAYDKKRTEEEAERQRRGKEAETMDFSGFDAEAPERPPEPPSPQPSGEPVAASAVTRPGTGSGAPARAPRPRSSGPGGIPRLTPSTRRPINRVGVSASPRPSTGTSPQRRPFFARVGLLVGSLAFAAAPVGVMAVWAPIFNANQHNFLVDLVGLGIGIGCLVWLFAGVVAVFRALGALFSD